MGTFDDLLGGPSAGKTEAEKDAAASELATKCGYAAAALTIIPLPLTESVATMPVHVGMVIGIGHIYGVEMTKEGATELILKIGATVGLSMVGTGLAIAAGKVLLPFLGGLAGAPFSFANTLALGLVARHFFKSQGEISDDEIRTLYKNTAKAARKEFDPTKARSKHAKDMAQAAAKDAESSGAVAPAEEVAPDPVARLERLKALLDKGLIEQDEFDSVKKKILDGI